MYNHYTPRIFDRGKGFQLVNLMVEFGYSENYSYGDNVDKDIVAPYKVQLELLSSAHSSIGDGRVSGEESILYSYDAYDNNIQCQYTDPKGESFETSCNASSFMDVHDSRPLLWAYETLASGKPTHIVAACTPSPLTGRDNCEKCFYLDINYTRFCSIVDNMKLYQQILVEKILLINLFSYWILLVTVSILLVLAKSQR